MTEKKQIYDIVVFEEYEGADGQTRTKSYNVGVAFETKNGGGLNCEIPSGISISERFSIFPRKEKSDAP